MTSSVATDRAITSLRLARCGPNASMRRHRRWSTNRPRLRFVEMRKLTAWRVRSSKSRVSAQSRSWRVRPLMAPLGTTCVRISAEILELVEDRWNIETLHRNRTRSWVQAARNRAQAGHRALPPIGVPGVDVGNVLRACERGVLGGTRRTERPPRSCLGGVSRRNAA